MLYPTKLTVTGVQSGEEHIINEDCTTGDKKEPTSTGAVGKYMTLFSGDDGMEYIEFKENNEFEMKVKDYDSTIKKDVDTIISGKYEYNATTKIITIDSNVPSIGGEQICVSEINYVESGIEKNNRILHVIDGSLIGSTDGFAGFDKYTFTSGTYKNPENQTLELSIKTDENGNSYGYLVAYGTDKTPYICLNGYIYVGWEPYKIVSETEIGHLDDDGNVNSVFTKVN